MTYRADVTIRMPDMPDGLTECQHRGSVRSCATCSPARLFRVRTHGVTKGRPPSCTVPEGHSRVPLALRVCPSRAGRGWAGLFGGHRRRTRTFFGRRLLGQVPPAGTEVPSGHCLVCGPVCGGGQTWSGATAVPSGHCFAGGGGLVTHGPSGGGWCDCPGGQTCV